MREIVFLLEGRSEKCMLEGLLPRVLPEDVRHRLITFEGKQDLRQRAAAKIRGYRNPQASFLMLVDQDSHPDCVAFKRELMDDLRTVQHRAPVVRIACHELETFYLADLAAVEAGLGLKGLAARQNKVKYRDPDRLSCPSAVLQELTGSVYQKIGGSRAIGPYLDPDNGRSPSFRNLVAGIRRLTA